MSLGLLKTALVTSLVFGTLLSQAKEGKCIIAISGATGTTASESITRDLKTLIFKISAMIDQKNSQLAQAHELDQKDAETYRFLIGSANESVDVANSLLKEVKKLNSGVADRIENGCVIDLSNVSEE